MVSAECTNCVYLAQKEPEGRRENGDILNFFPEAITAGYNSGTLPAMSTMSTKLIITFLSCGFATQCGPWPVNY